VLTGGFRKVLGAADFAAARDDLKMPPTAYVLPLSDRAAPNALVGLRVHQQVIERFGVVLAVENLRDVRGAAVNAALETLRRATIDSLLGFQPAADYDPIQYGGGRLLMLDVAVIWWQLEFITGYYERKV
ncbi:MAG TPA: hypothetical protein VFQ99_00965, partial [Gallionella sp.]|nr:hypothetical protein [Gallionella sp.]